MIINIETSITNLLVTDKESASIDITIKIRYPRENSGNRQINPINIAVTIHTHLGAVFIFFTLPSLIQSTKQQNPNPKSRKKECWLKLLEMHHFPAEFQ